MSGTGRRKTLAATVSFRDLVKCGDAEMIEKDVLFVTNSGITKINGRYEACSFGGHPHRSSRWYADSKAMVYFCLENRSCIYRSHCSDRFGPKWNGCWVIKDADGFTRYKSSRGDSDEPPLKGWEVFHGKVKGLAPPPTLAFGSPRAYWHTPPYWPRVTPPADFCVDERGVCRTFEKSGEYIRTVYAFRPPSLTQYASLDSKLKALSSKTADAAVRTLFLEGLTASQRSGARVLRVDSIVNSTAFRVYDAMRIAAERRLGKRRAREAMLWHGTAEENIAKICVNGFDRSFGKVAVYGHGVYFARDSGYSAAPRYSKPNKAGLQRMLLCRVLVCESCVGKQSFTAPQSKPFPRENENFESMVDDLKAPSIFVSTRDFQCYPEFCVTFSLSGSGARSTAATARLKIGVEVPSTPHASKRP